MRIELNSKGRRQAKTTTAWVLHCVIDVIFDLSHPSIFNYAAPVWERGEVLEYCASYCSIWLISSF